MALIITIFFQTMLGVAAVTCAKVPYRNLCPRDQLVAMVLHRLKDKRAMQHDIVMVESDFKILMKRAAQKQKSADAIAKIDKSDAGADAAKKLVKDAPVKQPQEGYVIPLELWGMIPLWVG